MIIDPSEIDAIKNPQEQHEFLAWLKTLRDYALKSFGMAKPEPAPTQKPPQPAAPAGNPDEDVFGDIVLKGWKKDQRLAGLPRKKSGWMQTGFGKVDDRHI